MEAFRAVAGRVPYVPARRSVVVFDRDSAASLRAVSTAYATPTRLRAGLRLGAGPRSAHAGLPAGHGMAEPRRLRSGCQHLPAYDVRG